MNWFDRQSSLTYIRITTQPSYYKTVLSGNDIFSYSKNGNDITITNTNSYEGDPGIYVIDLIGSISSIS